MIHETLANCTHERRAYWDCDCKDGRKCDRCDRNSECVDCMELLTDRPNYGLKEAPEPELVDETADEIGEPKPDFYEFAANAAPFPTSLLATASLEPSQRKRRRATINRRPEHERALSDATCTPKWLADMLPEVDFDPCSNPRSHIRARWAWSLEKGYDGLRMPWNGIGFVNWPYSYALPWAIKAIEEMQSGRCTGLIILCKDDSSTEWWDVITQPVYNPSIGLSYYPDLWLFHKRIQFDEHPELIALRAREVAEGTRKGAKSGKSSNNFCSAIIHHRFGAEPLKLDSVAQRWTRV